MNNFSDDNVISAEEDSFEFEVSAFFMYLSISLYVIENVLQNLKFQDFERVPVVTESAPDVTSPLLTPRNFP